MEFDDHNKIYGMRTQIDDEDLLKQGLFDKEKKMHQDRDKRDKSLFADFSFYLEKDVLDTAEAFGEQLSTMGASNAFIIGGQHTKSGKPIISSDPHLANQIPSVWHLSEIQAGSFHTIGGAFVGVPGTLLARSNTTAWGLTNTMADTSDLYLEKIDGEKYFHDGEWK